MAQNFCALAWEEIIEWIKKIRWTIIVRAESNIRKVARIKIKGISLKIKKNSQRF